MNEAITTVIAYSVKCGRDVMTHWLDSIPKTPTTPQIIDAARAHGLELVSIEVRS